MPICPKFPIKSILVVWAPRVLETADGRDVLAGYAPVPYQLDAADPAGLG